MALDHLVFEGKITDGMGCYSEMTFPQHQDMPGQLPPDWPDDMYPGSLNITMNQEGFPAALDAMGPGYGITRLDNGRFQPAAVIPRDKITNNMIRPTESAPHRGIAQIWRTAVHVERTGETIPVWMARRIGSAYTDVMEVMAPLPLRKTFGLRTGDRVTATVYANNNVSAAPVAAPVGGAGLNGLLRRFGLGG